MAKQDIYNLPNLVSLIRVLLAPVLLWLAIQQQPQWFLLLLLITVFTDVLDGFLARYLQQITEMGSRLDSWGDFLVYSVMAAAAWLLWPEIVRREAVYVVLVLLSLTLPVLIGFVKFRSMTSYHTWSVKVAVAVTVVAYILMFSDIVSWPFKLAAFFCLYAALEEIMITLLMKHQHVDVRTLRQAIRYNRQEGENS